MTEFRYAFLGLSITSSWGNGHATTYRSLLRQLSARGHEVTFLERDLPFYAKNRDLASPPYARTHLYGSLEELRDRYAQLIRDADLVVVGSYVPEGRDVVTWALHEAPGRTAFYDIDTPVTIASLDAGTCAYVAPEQLPRFALYMSFTGGPTLDLLRRAYHVTAPRALYCSVDPELYQPRPGPTLWDLGYLGTYSPDRQESLDRLFFDPARAWPTGRFVLAGAQYPEQAWPANVARTTHVAPGEHAAFYSAQRFALNVTRRPMVDAGWSPSVRLFEAAACGVPLITDAWVGLEAVLAPGREILVARGPADVLYAIRELPERRRVAIAEAARRRVLAEHTAMHRAESLERWTRDVLHRPQPSRRFDQARSQP